MTVTQIVALLKRQNPDWTDQLILDQLNFFQEMALKIASSSNVYYDPTTGDLPYLTTSDGVFEYDMPSFYFDVQAIVLKDTTFLTNNPNFTASNRGTYVYPSNKLRLGSHEYCEVPIKHKKALGPNGVCTVMFRFNPKDSTQTYQIYGYTGPANAIMSKSSVLNIPDKYHMMCVVPGVQTLIDGLDNGSFEDSIEKLKALYLPPIWADMQYDGEDNFSSRPMGI
jgi:hypothetical protein